MGCAVTYLVSIATFILLAGAFYVLIGKKRTGGEAVAFVLAIASAFPLLEGAYLLVKESGRLQDGRVAPGVVVSKLSSTGAEGSRTIGRGRRWSRRRYTINTINGFRLDDVLARWILTGSRQAWVIDYRYPCGSATCWMRDFVSQALWSELRVGQMVNVRAAKGLADTGRLDENPMWSTALVKAGIGGTGILAAAVISGRWPRRRRKLLQAQAIVTAVVPARTGGNGFRVEFSYVSADGEVRESVDEIYVPGLKPGDECTAIYPPERPDLGSLQV